jgi:glycosyltransferase involved in cell wall biosynthesis
MKILQIVSSSRISGAEKHVVILSERLIERGHSVTAVCPPGGWLPAQLREIGASVAEKPMHGVQFPPTARYLLNLIRTEGYDLIHAHLTCAAYLSVVVGRIAHLPVVASVHVRSRDPVYRCLFRQRGNHLITVSEWVRNAFLAQGVPAEQVHTIYNGTEFIGAETPALSRYHRELPVRAELSLPPDAELIGIFARVGEFKGHHILVQSVRRIVDARPRAYVVCAGAMEPRMQKALWEIAAADGVAERLRFTGVRDDVHRLMSEMDVLTLPSRYEACSMSIIEAMALGKPVIATRAGGNPELILDGETGLLIERTPEALASAIVSVLADQECKHRMGEAARARAETRFSANVMVDHIEALYRQVTQTNRALPSQP